MAMTRPVKVLLVALIIVAGGCAASPVASVPLPVGEPSVPVYVINHGLHTGIALQRGDIPAGMWPETKDFPHAEYIEVGWGDHDYYRARDPGIWTAFKAVLVPTASVLHVVGFRGPPETYFAACEIVRLELTRGNFASLVRYIHESHVREAAPVATKLGKGLYGDSRFYPSRDRFHLFNTCNLWIARALRAGGIPLKDAITAQSLMAQVKVLGITVSGGEP